MNGRNVTVVSVPVLALVACIAVLFFRTDDPSPDIADPIEASQAEHAASNSTPESDTTLQTIAESSLPDTPGPASEVPLDSRSTALHAYADHFLEELKRLAKDDSRDRYRHLLSELLGFLKKGGYELSEFLESLIREGPLPTSREGDVGLKDVLSLRDELQVDLASIVSAKANLNVRRLASLLLRDFTRMTTPELRNAIFETVKQETDQKVKLSLMSYIASSSMHGNSVDREVVKTLLSLVDYSDNDWVQQNLFNELSHIPSVEVTYAMRAVLEDPHAPDDLKGSVIACLDMHRRVNSEPIPYSAIQPVLLEALQVSPEKKLTFQRRALLAQAANELGRVRDSKAVPHLAHLLGTGRDPDARAIAAFTLRWFPQDEIRELLSSTASDPRESVSLRVTSIRSLGMMMTSDMETHLQSLAAHPDTPANVATAIGKSLQDAKNMRNK